MSTPARPQTTFAARPSPARLGWLLAAGAGAAACWWGLWTVRTFWNPLLFTGLWTAATVFLRAATCQPPLPLRRHLACMALSAPMWWWFELVNEAVHNWRYHGAEQYTWLQYQVFATLAFSTVVPALHAVWTATTAWLAPAAGPLPVLSKPAAWRAIAVGLAAQAAVFAWPGNAYSLVWVAPWLVAEGAAGLLGRGSLLGAMRAGRWHLPLAVALAGVLTGVAWELWNYWAWPKWTYDVPYVNFWHVFEMPLLGYLGYVPFVWSVYQLVAVAAALVARLRRVSVA